MVLILFLCVPDVWLVVSLQDSVGTNSVVQISISVTGVDRANVYPLSTTFRYHSSYTPRLDFVPRGGGPGSRLYFQGFLVRAALGAITAALSVVTWLALNSWLVCLLSSRACVAATLILGPQCRAV